MEFDEIFTELIKRSRPSLVSAPPVSLTIFSSFFIPKYAVPRQTEGVGTVRSHHNQTYADDGGLSSDSGISDDEGEFTDPQESNLPISKPILDIRIPAKPPQLVIHAPSPSPPTPTPGNLPTPIPTALEPTPKASAGFSVPTPRFMPKMRLGRKFPGLSTTPASPPIDAHGAPVSSVPTRNKFVRSWSSGTGTRSPSTSTSSSGNEGPSATSIKHKSDFKYEGANDIVGIVMLEIQSASDLPRLSNRMFDVLSPFFIY